MTAVPSVKVYSYPSVDSTNRKAKELALEGAACGTVVVASEQKAGRGSGNRTWHSPLGGLYLSALLKAKDPRRSVELAILAGAAVSQAVAVLLPKAYDITVKWPNDILIGWKKVAGVLCERLEGSELAIIGIGVNVNIEREELEGFIQNPFSATSFSIEVAGKFDLKLVEITVLKKLFSLYELYCKEGFHPIQYLWERNCRFIGKRIELRDRGWKTEQNRKVRAPSATGTVLGIDDSGALVLSNARGERSVYVTGEITCFWQ